jgi:hypothetical protein
LQGFDRDFFLRLQLPLQGDLVAERLCTCGDDWFD